MKKALCVSITELWTVVKVPWTRWPDAVAPSPMVQAVPIPRRIRLFI